jgi:hypothetical protein
MRALGLVNRTVREINEMRYEFDEPVIVAASRAETEVGPARHAARRRGRTDGALVPRKRTRPPRPTAKARGTSRPGLELN